MQKFHTLAEAAEILRCHKEQVRGFILSGELVAVPIGKGKQRRQWIIAEQSLNDFVARRIAAAQPQPKTRKSKPPAKSFI